MEKICIMEDALPDTDFFMQSVLFTAMFSKPFKALFAYNGTICVFVKQKTEAGEKL